MASSYSRGKTPKSLAVFGRRPRWWHAAWLCLVFWPAAAEAQSSTPNAQDRSEDAAQFGEWALGELGPGSNNRVAASLIRKRASLFHAMGRYDDAEPLYVQLLALLETELGPDHPRVVFGRNNLAAFYLEQGKYAEAEPVYAKALKALERVLGSEHPQVAQGLNNLAGVYKEQGKLAAAEPLFERALAIRVKSLGPTDPRVGESLNNLAGLYRDQGKFVAAEPLYKRSLAILENAFGAAHPLVATTLDNFAVLLRATRRTQEATNAEAYADALRARWDAQRDRQVRRARGPEI